MGISINSNDDINVNWVQNGIKNKKTFRSLKEAEKFLAVIEEVQNSIKLAEEFERFNRDFKYDPNILSLKIEAVEKEIGGLKESLRIKHALQKKVGTAVQKLAEQPRNVIGKEEFLKEIKSLKAEIERLDRFFREHSIVTLHKSLLEAVGGMKSYFHSQQESIRQIEELFKGLRKEVIEKLGSITTRDKVLAIEDVMKYLSVSRATVNEAMFGGGLPFFKVGNRYRIKENDLKKWIDDRRKTLGRNVW